MGQSLESGLRGPERIREDDILASFPRSNRVGVVYSCLWQGEVSSLFPIGLSPTGRASFSVPLHVIGGDYGIPGNLSDEGVGICHMLEVYVISGHVRWQGVALTHTAILCFDIVSDIETRM